MNVFIYNENEEAFHLILSNKQIQSAFLIPCQNKPFNLDEHYSYEYFINEKVILDNKISEFIQEIIDICFKDIKLLWIDVKEYDVNTEFKEVKAINVLSKDINIIKYALEYDIYDYFRKLELIYK